MNKTNSNNVYLIPCGDRAYHSTISETPPTSSAIFMVAEGSYPVELWWIRHDLNMCRILEMKICESREELVELLDFLGKCGNNVEHLWEYEDRTTSNTEISRLFDVCFERKREETIAAFEEAIADLDSLDAECFEEQL